MLSMKNIYIKKLSYVSFLALAAMTLPSCSENTDPNTIFVSSAPVYVLVKEIVKDIKPIEIVTPSGVEAHDYEISARKVAKIYDGLCLFINGLGLESWSDTLPNKAKGKTYDLSSGISPVCIDGNIDPHIWLNPKNAIKELENIKDALITIDSANSANYLSNYEQAKSEFEALDQRSEQIAKSLNNKYLCVSHAAFGYLCDRYGLTQISVNGLEPDTEPTSKTLEEIINAVKEYKINTVFAEEAGSKEIVKKISEETGCKLETLSTMESIEEGETYCSIFESNFSKILEAGK